jgi:hypothetical protein
MEGAMHDRQRVRQLASATAAVVQARVLVDWGAAVLEGAVPVPRRDAPPLGAPSTPGARDPGAELAAAADAVRALERTLAELRRDAEAERRAVEVWERKAALAMGVGRPDMASSALRRRDEHALAAEHYRAGAAHLEAPVAEYGRVVAELREALARRGRVTPQDRHPEGSEGSRSSRGPSSPRRRGSS